MAKITYAVEINTGVAVSVPQIGHTIDGYMRLITGRPGYDGSPTYPTWEDTTNNTDVWYEGIVLKDGVSSPVRMIDIRDGGNYATQSGMTISLSNASKLWDYLGNNSIYLENRPVTMYVVIDDVFYSAWSGVISDTSYNDTVFSIICDSNYRKIHKTLPPNSINKSIYPESSIDDDIPVVLGNVPFSKILQTGQNDTNITVDYNIDGQPVKRCSFNWYVPYDYITLLTLSKQYRPNELDGKYLRPVSGSGAEIGRIIKIKSSDASTPGAAAGIIPYYETKIYIDESFDLDQATVNSHSYSWATPATSIDDIWWFEIIDAKTEFIVSNNTVSSIETDDYGQPILNYYDDDTGKMYDVHGLITSIEENKGRDSVNLIRTNENKAGELSYVVYHGASVKVARSNGESLSDIYLPFVTYNVGNDDNMVDNDRSTETDNIVDSPFEVSASDHPDTPHRYTDGVFDLDLSEFDLRDAENICIGIDLEMIIDPHSSATSPFDVGCGVDFRLIDTYGRVMVLSDDMGVNYTYEQECAAYPTPTTLDFNFLPNDYYKLGNDNGETSIFGEVDNDFNQVRDYLFLPDALVDMIVKKNVCKVRMTLNISSYSACFVDSIKVKQVGVFSYQTIETDKEKLYLKVGGGEKYDVSTDTSSCYNALRHLLENYDNISPSNIDYDNLVTERTTATGWTLGRQIIKNKNALEYLMEMCKYFFIGMFIDRRGVLNATAFKEKSVVVEDFDETNIIRGSIGKLKKISILKVYNEFVFKWGYNNGSEKYDKIISINNVDSMSTFPDFLDDDTGVAGAEIVVPAVTACDYYSTGYGVVEFASTVASLLTAGDSITIYLTSGGVITSSVIYFAKITKVDTDTIYFEKPLIQTTSVDYEVGITNVKVYKHSSGSNLPQWMTLVNGIKSYSTAKTLWDACRESYEKTGVIKAYPDLECDWFFNEEVFYSLDEMPYDTSPMLFLQNFIDWVSIQKETVPFSVPITSDSISMNLLDYSSFTDAIITYGITRYGWITKSKINTKNNTIEFELMLKPGGYSEMGDIIETGSAADEIEESGSQIDEIEEGV